MTNVTPFSHSRVVLERSQTSSQQRRANEHCLLGSSHSRKNDECLALVIPHVSDNKSPPSSGFYDSAVVTVEILLISPPLEGYYVGHSLLLLP
jgi:hypothetical protein